jgi:hypothetical protein
MIDVEWQTGSLLTKKKPLFLIGLVLSLGGVFFSDAIWLFY